MLTHQFFALFYFRPNVFFGHFVPSRSVNTYIHIMSVCQSGSSVSQTGWHPWQSLERTRQPTSIGFANFGVRINAFRNTEVSGYNPLSHSTGQLDNTGSEIKTVQSLTYRAAPTNMCMKSLNELVMQPRVAYKQWYVICLITSAICDVIKSKSARIRLGLKGDSCTCLWGETGPIAQTKPNLPVDAPAFSVEHELNESSQQPIYYHVSLAVSSKIQSNKLFNNFPNLACARMQNGLG